MSAPAPVLNNDVVAIAWVAAIPAVAALAAQPPVGATLPAGAPPSWAATGFLQVLTTGGSPHPDFPFRQPVATIFTWATRTGSKKPPWDAAARLAEYVFAACYAETPAHSRLVPVAGGVTYPPVLVKTANALSEPRKIPGDPAGFARYMLDIQLKWVPA
jgi:hypothetical protein